MESRNWNTDAAQPVRHTLRARDRDGAGIVRPSVLMTLADRAAIGSVGNSASMTDFKTLYLAPPSSAEIIVTARLRHRSTNCAHVEAEFSGTDGVSFGVLALRYEAIQPPAPENEAVSNVRPLEIATTPLRERRSDKLLHAATEVIGEKGFAGATIRDISKAAGVHVPTFYEYFSSKEVLLEAIYAREMERALAAMQLDVPQTSSASEKLEKLLTNQLRHAEKNRQSVALLNREFRNLSPEVREDMAVLYRKLLEPFEKTIAEGIASGEFRDVDPFLAANFMEVGGDIWALRPFFFKRRSPETFIEQLRKLLVEGLQAS